MGSVDYVSHMVKEMHVCFWLEGCMGKHLGNPHMMYMFHTIIEMCYFVISLLSATEHILIALVYWAILMKICQWYSVLVFFCYAPYS